MAPGGRRIAPRRPDSNASTALTRNVRGRAANNIVDKYNALTGQKARVEFKKGLSRPVGKWAKEFTTEVGIACRMFAPLTCKKWKEVDDEARDKFHERILEKFDFDLHIPYVRKIVNKFLAQRLREYRCRLHKLYKNLPNNVEKRQNGPKYVSHEHWIALCAHFEEENFQKLSEKNSENRGKLLVNHRGGSKPFVRHREEQRDAETQQECGRIELYRMTHFSDTKGWINPIAAKNYEDMCALKAQPIEEGASEKSEDEICDIVLGKRPGYIRGLGNGVLPLSFSSSPCFHPDVDELRKRAEIAERQHLEAEKRNEELSAQVNDQGNQIQGLVAWQTRMEAIMSQFCGRSF